MRRALVGLTIAVAVGGGVGLGFRLGSSRQGPKTTISEMTPATQPPFRPGPSPPSPSPMRVAIRKEIALTQEKACSDVDAQLDSFEARARKQGKVTALEIEPG